MERSLVSSLRVKNTTLRGLTKKHSSKPERILADQFIRNAVPFEFRKIISNREVDFVLGRVIVEVDGLQHNTPRARARDRQKNEMLVQLGYIPLHVSTKEVRSNPQGVFREIKKLVEANN